MKKFLFFSILFCSLWACNQGDELPYNEQISNDSFVGNWEWVSTGGGFTGHYEGPEVHGSHILTLTNGSAYELTSDENVLASGKYEINEMVINNNVYDEVTFHDFPITDNGLIALSPQDNILISNEKLFLGSALIIEYKREE